MGSETPLLRFFRMCPAGLKLLLLLLASTVLVALESPYWLTGSAVISVLFWLLLGRGPSQSGPLQPAQSGLLWFGFMILALGAYSAWLEGPGAAVATIARLIALITLAMIVMRTTPVTAMMSAIERFLMPLGKLGWVNPSKVALAFGMMVRFLPVLREQWDEIQQAQTARGLRARPHALLVPMLARTLSRAQEVAETLDARGLSD